MLSPAGEDEYCLDEIIAMRNLLGSTSWCHFGDGINIYDGSFHIDTFAAEMNLTMFDSLTNISTPNPAKCDAIMMMVVNDVDGSFAMGEPGVLVADSNLWL